jgi:hypothetical protein
VRRSGFVPRRRASALRTLWHSTIWPRHTLNDLSFDNNLGAGGWRGYAQKAAKDAFVTEARSWLEPLQKLLDTEQARLLTLENATADDFMLVVTIQRQVGRLKRYLKISNTVDDAPRHQTKLRLHAL